MDICSSTSTSRVSQLISEGSKMIHTSTWKTASLSFTVAGTRNIHERPRDKEQRTRKTEPTRNKKQQRTGTNNNQTTKNKNKEIGASAQQVPYCSVAFERIPQLAQNHRAFHRTLDFLDTTLEGTQTREVLSRPGPSLVPDRSRSSSSQVFVSARSGPFQVQWLFHKGQCLVHVRSFIEG